MVVYIFDKGGKAIFFQASPKDEYAMKNQKR